MCCCQVRKMNKVRMCRVSRCECVWSVRVVQNKISKRVKSVARVKRVKYINVERI